MLIVVFANLNEDTPTWDLVYNMQFYLIVSVFLYLGFELCKDILTRSLLFTVGFYYLFELTMDIINIINSDIYYFIYSSRNITYTFTIGFMIALVIFPAYNHFKNVNDV
jgi:peptidoglycan/LPS O-acetylase OafA/YrhL